MLVGRVFGSSAVVAVSLVLAASLAAAEPEEPGFVKLWDGKTFDNWKANENKESWKIEEGALVAKGLRSHIFYTGPEAPFTNFELRIDCKTTKGSNGGIYFHTKYQESGWPKYGFEAQVNNSHTDPKRTGSLYGLINVSDPPSRDDEWYTETVIVKGDKITIKVNDKVVVDYTEPPGTKPGADYTRKIDSGTFALQAHDPQSVVYFKNIRVKKL